MSLRDRFRAAQQRAAERHQANLERQADAAELKAGKTLHRTKHNLRDADRLRKQADASRERAKKRDTDG